MRLDARCEALVIAGLLEETGRLFCEGKLPPGSSGSRAIGYRQAIDYLCRPDPETGDEQALDAFLADFMTATQGSKKEDGMASGDGGPLQPLDPTEHLGPPPR
eukprot:EG_transcript_12498